MLPFWAASNKLNLQNRLPVRKLEVRTLQNKITKQKQTNKQNFCVAAAAEEDEIHVPLTLSVFRDKIAAAP